MSQLVETEGLGELFQRTDRARGVAYSFTKHSADAEDLVQDAFLIAIQRAPSSSDSLWPWFVAVMANCSRNHWRKAKLRSNHVGGETHPICQSSPDSHAQQVELRERLITAMDSLPEKEREAIALCHVAGLTRQEACLVTGARLCTLKARIARGLSRLRQFLMDREGAVAQPPSHPVADEMDWNRARLRWEHKALNQLHALTNSIRENIQAKLGQVLSIALLLATAWLICSPQTYDDDTPPSKPEKRCQGTNKRNGATDGASDPRDNGQEENKEKTKDTTDTRSTKPDSSEPEASRPTRVRSNYMSSGCLEAHWTEEFQDGKWVAHGLFTRYHESGVIAESGNYVNGLCDGSWSSWHSNGQLESTGAFRTGRKEGDWNYHAKNGQLIATGWYATGVRSGEWRIYYETGGIKRIETVQYGRLIHTSYYFDEEGQEERRICWSENGKPSIEYLNVDYEATQRSRAANDGEPQFFAQKGKKLIAQPCFDSNNAGDWR